MKKGLVFGLAMLFGSAAAPLAVHAAGTQTYDFEPSVVAFNQSASDKIKIDFAHLPKNGYIAIYKGGADGKASGEPIGYTKLEKGDHRGFEVELKKEVKSGDRLWVSMYKDTDNDPSFKPGDKDKPMWSKDQLPSDNMVLIQ